MSRIKTLPVKDVDGRIRNYTFVLDGDNYPIEILTVRNEGETEAEASERIRAILARLEGRPLGPPG